MLVALDFESDAIDNRPKYPPTPVGLAVYIDGQESEYHAWKHPKENNTTLKQVTLDLGNILKNPAYEFIFHNAPFDCSIIEEKLGLPVPWDRCHDTMLMAFLLDPFGELSLKPLAERYLGLPPTERDAVRDWLIANKIVRANDKSWGAHIGKAPGKLVGEYAKGDVIRTLDLFKFFLKQMEKRSC